MSKRGNSSLRRLFIHGARSASMHMKRDRGLGPWLDQLETRTHKNVAVVALANKIVRISWAVLAPAGRVSAARADRRLSRALARRSLQREE